MKWKEKNEELKTLILEEKKSYEEIGRKFNVSGAAIKKAAQRLGIALETRRKINEKEHFNKGTAKIGICENCGNEFVKYKSTNGRFCCSKCSAEYRHKEKYNLVLKGDESIMRANYSPRNFKYDIIKEQGGVCAICGCKPIHNGKPLIFIVDHIDGDAANTCRENLRCICPNCDSQLDTFKSKNKNGARHYYRYHKNKNMGM